MAFAILDCTLRDGGYYTDWDFERPLVDRYLRAMASLPVRYVEAGYRSPPLAGYAGEYFYLPLSTLEYLRAALPAEIGLSLMLNAKDCRPEQMDSLLGNCRDMVRLVRLAVDPAKLESALLLAERIKALGFEVAINLMYLSKVDETHQAFRQLEGLGDAVDYVNLVDSYGSCFPDHVGRLFATLKERLQSTLGFHGHNNIGLAFANTLAAIEQGAEIVDSTVLGMGRGAGNLQTELLIAYAAHRRNMPLDLNPLSETLDDFKALQRRYEWGMDLPYILSGLNGLPQKEVMTWLGMKRFSTGAIIRALQQHAEARAEQAPVRHPPLGAHLTKLGLADCRCSLVIGGGPSASKFAPAIADYARRNRAVLIHASLKNVPAYAGSGLPQVVCLPGDELYKLPDMNSDASFAPVAAVFSISHDHADLPDPLAGIAYSVVSLVEEEKGASVDPLTADPPLSLALGVARDMQLEEVALVGFDGYEMRSETQAILARETQEAIDLFRRRRPEVALVSLTATRYEVPRASLFSRLP